MSLEISGKTTEALEKRIKELESENLRLKSKVNHNAHTGTNERVRQLDLIPFVFFSIHKNGTIVEANTYAKDYFSLITSKKNTSICGIPIEELFDGDSDITHRIDRIFLEKNISDTGKIHVKGHPEKWIAYHLHPEFDEAGQQIDKIVFAGIDISENKIMEDQLRQNESWLDQIYSEVPVMIFTIDEQAIVRHANKKWLERLGYNRDDVIGKKIKLFLPEKSKEIVFGQIIPEFLVNDKILNKEIQIIEKSGELMDVRFSIVKTIDSEGRFSAVTVVEDITEIKHAQDELKLKEQILHQISDNSADIIWMTDKHYKITYVSNAVEQILGYTPEEIKQLDLATLQSREDLKLKKKTHFNHFPKKRQPDQTFKPIHLEIQHIHKDGSRIWTDMLSSPLYDESNDYCGLVGIVRDNSERKATELAMRESQELYRSLIELSPEGIIILNNGEIEFANREFIKMLKVEREKQIVERNFLDLVMLKDHEIIRKWLKRVEQFKADDEVIIAELKRFDGTPLYAEVMATPVTIRGENSAQLFVRDVTQRILTGNELNKERELNENLIKSIPDYIYFKDKEGKFIKINRAFSKALSLSKPADAIGKSDIDFFGIKHFQKTQKEEKQIIKTKKPLIGAIREEPWENNEIQWVSVTKMPLFGPDREVVGTFGVSRDITKQKKSEEEIRRREERFRQLFGQIQVGMAIINTKFEILEVNTALCDISKYHRKELVNGSFLTLFGKTTGEEFKSHIKNNSNNQATNYHLECKLKLKTGKSAYVILKIIKLDSSEELKGQLLCQVIDINDRKVAEDQLNVRNSELNNFVYKVSHDLRAPLLSVKGLINLLRIEDSPEIQAGYIGMIEDRVEKLDGFIRDILSHSKNLNTEVSISEIDLKEIIEACFAQMQYHANAHRIEKKVVVKGTKFYSDNQRLQEILRNLISNAVIYCAMNRVQSFVNVTVQCKLNTCTIIVEDNGLGIKKAYLDKIFQMFYRANDLVDGTGIGLYIVQQSIHKLGGEVNVESKLNSGTKFTLTIPNNTP